MRNLYAIYAQMLYTPGYNFKYKLNSYLHTVLTPTHPPYFFLNISWKLNYLEEMFFNNIDSELLSSVQNLIKWQEPSSPLMKCSWVADGWNKTSVCCRELSCMWSGGHSLSFYLRTNSGSVSVGTFLVL